MIEIGDQKVGEGQETFVIAEAGSNHNGDLEKAKKLINVAADAGADAVKFQTFKSGKVYAKEPGKAEYLEDERDLREILDDMEMPYDWIPELKEYADEKGIIFMSTPGFEEAADELEQYVPAFKVESFMLTHYPFLEHLMEKGKPIILSTGAHDMQEVEEAVDFMEEKDYENYAVLHCVSSYPTPIDQINVNVVKTFRDKFDVVSGLSDHTMDPAAAPTTAVAVGADIIEKHFTLDRSMEGPDHEFALEPRELEEMVTSIRKTEQALGNGGKRVLDIERELEDKARKFVQADQDIGRGEKITKQNSVIISPGERESGVEPKHYEDVLGKKAEEDIDEGEGITFDKIE